MKKFGLYVMPYSNTKGKHGESEAANRVNGTVISVKGKSGPDVADSLGRTWEVKRPAKFSKQALDYLKQAREEGAVGVLVRPNYRKEWVLMIDVDQAEALGWINVDVHHYHFSGPEGPCHYEGCTADAFKIEECECE